MCWRAGLPSGLSASETLPHGLSASGTCASLTPASWPLHLWDSLPPDSLPHGLSASGWVVIWPEPGRRSSTGRVVICAGVGSQVFPVVGRHLEGVLSQVSRWWARLWKERLG